MKPQGWRSRVLAAGETGCGLEAAFALADVCRHCRTAGVESLEGPYCGVCGGSGGYAPWLEHYRAAYVSSLPDKED